jgi:hypothetical protein
MYFSVQAGGPVGQLGEGGYLMIAYHVRMIRPLLAGFDFVTNEADLREARDVLSTGQRGWLPLLGGRVLFTGSKLYRNTGSASCVCGNGPCDICFRQAVDRSYAIGNLAVMFRERIPGPPGSAPSAAWQADTLAHEIGHSVFGLPDEYRDHNAPDGLGPGNLCHSDTSCEHSFMSNYISWTMCRNENHGWSVHPYAHYTRTTQSGGTPFPAGCDESAVTRRIGGPGVWNAFPTWINTDRVASPINPTAIPAFQAVSTVEVVR